ncbi:MAG: hypothetical protein IT578_05580 [Verrucomicrobiae bacterium]|nr:hypothetical protein [Verrucomicrobiae bacterium]
MKRSWGFAAEALLALSSLGFAAAPIAVRADDIRDIRGVVSVPTPWQWLLYPAAALALVAVAVALVRRWRRPKPLPPPPPHEMALARLRAAEALIAENKPREFGIAVSDAVREYIEARFSLLAAHRTTEEFIAERLADENSSLRPHREPLRAFLQSCDLAKFARWALDETAMRELWEHARAFVEATRPQPISPQDPKPTLPAA